MIYKQTILTKILGNGLKAVLVVAKDEGIYRAALMVNGRFIHGPPLPEPLNSPKDGLTHWMGNRPSVGLTTAEAEKIIKAVSIENSVIIHRKLEAKISNLVSEPGKKGFLSELKKIIR